MRHNPQGTKLHLRGRNRLKNFYELTTEDINLLYKYGYGSDKGIKGMKGAPTDKGEIRRIERRLQVIESKMNTAAHVKTQGASINLYMPKFAEQKHIKPLTLFKRMAYAATANTLKNSKEAYNSGNMMRLATGTLATYVTGSALFGLYSALLGVDMPKENSPWWTQFKTTMWKGEFLGLMSEFFSPYGESTNQSILPAVASNAYEGFTTVLQLARGETGIGMPYTVQGKNQGFDGFLRKTLSIYNAKQKFLENKNTPYNRSVKKFNNLYNDFIKEMDYPDPKVEIGATKLNKYTTSLKNAFNNGTSKDFADAFVTAYYAKASELYNAGAPTGTRHYTLNQAFKDANTFMKNQLRNLDPSNRPSKGAKRQTVARYRSWIKWLDRDENKNLKAELGRTTAQYMKKHNDFTKQLRYYIRKHNLKDLAKDFKWLHKI